MKTSMLPLSLLFLWVGGAQCLAAVVQGEPTITERGPHHRVWSRQDVRTLPDGLAVTNVYSYIEVGSGLHRWDPEVKQWVDTDNSIEILPDGSGAVSHRGAHQVAFAANLNTRGAITLQTPDGKRLVSHVVGLAWFEASSGRSEMFAEVKDSIGILHGTDTVIYPDAFEGVNAAVRYSNRKGGFEQDIILYEHVSPPAGYAPDSTRLEVWTEFIEAPAAYRTQRGRGGMTDDTLDWGAMQTGPGRAFLLGEGLRGARATVAKRWLVTADNRTFLVEAVRYQFVKRDLDQLPPRQAGINPQGNAVAVLAKASQGFNGERLFPPAPKARDQKAADKFRTAAVLPSTINGESTRASDQIAQAAIPIIPKQGTQKPKPVLGFVIDYDIVGSLTNFTFQGDTTYYAANTVNFHGTTIFEGGTVVKFAKTNTAQLTFNNGVEWRTGPYRPAIFTAKDDNKVGVFIAGSTGTPSGYYGGKYLAFNNDAGTPQHLRISYANVGISSANYQPLIRHAQFLHCSNSLSMELWATALLTLENILFYNVSAVYAGQCQLAGAHLSVHQCGKFFNGSVSPTPTVTLINSIFVRMTNWGNVSSNLTACIQGTNDSVFQTVGGGGHYLAAGSMNRNAGTTAGISATLLADLKKRTTFPPVLLTNAITNNSTLSLQAQRDTDTPDLGYSYDPLDYLVSGLIVTNASVLAKNGLAIGIDYASSGWGFILKSAQFVSEGGPLTPNRIVRAHTAQEQSSGNPGTRACFYDGSSSTTDCQLRMRFTEFSQLSDDGYMIYVGTKFNAMEWTHSRVYNPALVIDTSGAGTLVCGLTNTLWERGGVQFGDSSTGTGAGVSVHLRNNLHRNVSWHFVTGNSTWTVQDNLFDTLPALDDHGSPVNNSYNAHYSTTYNLSGGANNLTLTNLAYEIGPLGNFYLPEAIGGEPNPLLDAGSRSAAAAGLYHFTTQTNQTAEATSTVDIGLHYVAVDENGNPNDSDEDGLADFLEDANGNGAVDSGEANMLETDTDADGLTDYQEAVLIGTNVCNPLLWDTDNNGIRDGADDPDQDQLTTEFELNLFGSKPTDKFSMNKAANGNSVTRDGHWWLASVDQSTNAAGNALARLSVQSVSNQTIVRLTAMDVLTPFTYDAIMTGPTQWKVVTRGIEDQAIFDIPFIGYAGTPYYSVGLSYDYDEDGLPDGYEILVSNTKIGIDDSLLDSDSDGIPDWWELVYGLDPRDAYDAGLDTDGDESTNLEEFLMGTNPIEFPEFDVRLTKPPVTSPVP